MIRLNKYLADCGVCSRRKADELILSGRVTVNSKKVTELGTTVNEDNDSVAVDKRKVTPVRELTYIMFNKPKGCVTTVSDEKGRKCVEELVRDYITEENGDPETFGNARGVRNIFEHILVAQNNRLAAMETVTKEDLMTLTQDDVLHARGKLD